MHEYSELTLARRDMKEQDLLYRPTVFWDEISLRVDDEICSHGIDRFRSLPTTLQAFVPTYGIPFNGFTKEKAQALYDWLEETFAQSNKPKLSVKNFISGEFSALADYRVLLAADNQKTWPLLHTFSESSVGSPLEQFEFDGRRFSRASLNYLLGLAFLKKHLGGEVPRTVLEIGGGFGSLGEVLSGAGIDGLRYVNIDIPPMNFVSQYYLSEVLGAENVATYAKTKDQPSIHIDDLPMVSVLCSWQIEKLQGKVDLFVNFISFQEMEPHVVRNYAKHVKRLGARWILLRSIREGKQLRTADNPIGVETPVMPRDYMEMFSSYELVERNVFPFGFRTVDGFHSELFLLKKKSAIELSPQTD